MISKIAFTLLARSQGLARTFALHALRKREGALPTAKNKLAVTVPVFGVIDVCIDLEGDSWALVRSALETNRVVFGLDIELSNHLVGRVDSTPWFSIWVGHKNTLHLAVGPVEVEGLQVRRP